MSYTQRKRVEAGDACPFLLEERRPLKCGDAMISRRTLVSAFDDILTAAPV